ncbi:bifunctional diaminohydroxyphosphoribosylaminopyrimidine deaminase/5-amino-6-(5-phosphoribosylamino)uracil reductase RibD [Candidatus Peregrinibacteria bacterium]|nr:bifunctional diaminohydroxyphosphoribosylaminopyrimidine deaminase/5-amino-6-(5-phosphoribosylamino)uracil reductase RibD [Candidatus Peregrinibacteria bacterium]
MGGEKDEFFMRQVLELAKQGESFVSPNPMVGAVIVCDGGIVAAWHRKFGGPHAEVLAISLAEKKKMSVKGGTLYVNLEPCVDFEGKKTHGCADAIIKAGIKRVVVGMLDPNPRVARNGVKALRKAGISVDVGCLGAEAQKMNKVFVKFIKTGVPFVTVKIGMSLDGKIATKTRESKWITGEISRAKVKKIRDANDAILVGINTVLHDNPELCGAVREPLRVILDSRLRCKPDAKVLRDSNIVIIATARAAKSKIKLLEKCGARVKILGKKIEINPLLRYLGKIGISSVLVEGGSEIFGSFIDSKCVDKVYWFIAPKIIGGRDAIPAVGGSGITNLKNALSLRTKHIHRFGEDILIEGTL